MRDYLLDIVKNTYGLGIIDLVKIAGTDTETNIELARRRLEDKIAQLNGAIDDVRHQLASVDNLSLETPEESQN
jgi:hypothetical protein